MKENAAYWINHLKLQRHIEGGHFREFYRSSFQIPRAALAGNFKGDRSASTSIYFLLQQDEFSALHRIASDELWHFYSGDLLSIYELSETGNLTIHRLGSNPGNGESLQVIIRAGSWFGARLYNGGEYALVGCTVAPGFDFDDFELGDRSSLIRIYPQHKDIIELLTRTSS